MSYTIYKQGIAQGNIALVNDKIQCGPTLEMVKETGPTGYQSWMNTHLSLNRLIESMRLPKQSDADLYASLGKRLSGFLYAVEQDTPATKGGPGSGNFGHAGRPGRIGGSQSDTGTNRPRTVFGVRVARPVSLGDYLTAKHYADLKINTKKPVVTDPAFLPKVKEGYTRVYHGTSAQKTQSILDRGLLFGSTVKDREALPFVMATTGSTSSFGEVNFVVDLSPESMEKVQKVNESWVEIYQEIKPVQIVGIYLRPHRIGMEDAVWLRDAILEHKDLSE